MSFWPICFQSLHTIHNLNTETNIYSNEHNFMKKTCLKLAEKLDALLKATEMPLNIKWLSFSKFTISNTLITNIQNLINAFVRPKKKWFFYAIKTLHFMKVMSLLSEIGGLLVLLVNNLFKITALKLLPVLLTKNLYNYKANNKQQIKTQNNPKSHNKKESSGRFEVPWRGSWGTRPRIFGAVRFVFLLLPPAMRSIPCHSNAKVLIEKLGFR